jgi:hypothetical protein
VGAEEVEGHLDGREQHEIAAVFQNITVTGYPVHLFHHRRFTVAGKKNNGKVPSREHGCGRLGAAHPPAEVYIHKHQIETASPRRRGFRQGSLPAVGGFHQVAVPFEHHFFGQGDDGLVLDQKKPFFLRHPPRSPAVCVFSPIRGVLCSWKRSFLQASV